MDQDDGLPGKFAWLLGNIQRKIFIIVLRLSEKSF